ncbi:hypothetical protein GJR96_09285 [Haloferax sp. MBLA0076]|uniref:Uncharacterized protein n=1 Tax=Haloferax litoreum TaxID=2666140 RepID=A0A6A8GGX4_9EURY|nr:MULTISPECIES: hypothetical protein [Haloferax]KAB1193623.1 hypothetical protein Hfx1148_09270 [Haloferax sp. CBA1148]MRX22146.1 hypothetical protein [Haloferax litoreum]
MNETSPLEKAAAVVGSIFAGAVMFLESLLTLDPSFLLSGDWYGVTALFTRFIGPEILPSLPWETMFFVAAVGMLAVSLYKFRTSRQ